MHLLVLLMKCSIILFWVYFIGLARGAGDAPATKKSKDTDVEIQGRTVRWEWEGDGGKWMQYSKEHSLALTDALSKGKNQVR